MRLLASSAKSFSRLSFKFSKIATDETDNPAKMAAIIMCNPAEYPMRNTHNGRNKRRNRFMNGQKPLNSSSEPPSIMNQLKELPNLGQE